MFKNLEDLKIKPEVLNELLSKKVTQILHDYNGKPGLIAELVIYTQADSTSELVPHILIFNEVGKTSKEKYNILYEAGKKFYHDVLESEDDALTTYPLVVFWTSEAYILELPNEKALEARMAKPVHDYADKREVIVTIGLTWDERSNSAFLEMKRDPKDDSMQLQIRHYNSYITGSKESPVIDQDNILKGFYKGIGVAGAERLLQDLTKGK